MDFPPQKPPTPIKCRIEKMKIIKVRGDPKKRERKVEHLLNEWKKGSRVLAMWDTLCLAARAKQGMIKKKKKHWGEEAKWIEGGARG